MVPKDEDEGYTPLGCLIKGLVIVMIFKINGWV